MTCKDCIHFDVCQDLRYGDITNCESDGCGGFFKPKSRFVELPCEVGQTVYCIEHNTIHECLVKMVKSLTYENKTIFFVETECEIVSPFYSDGRKIKHGIVAVWEIEYGSWHRAFRTREEAENALRERSK